MASLTQDNKGNFKARKRIPRDVQDEYGRLYGPRLEAKFYAPATTKAHVAKQLFGEFVANVEARIAAIRAQHKGEGVSLTPRQARALAGEWYDWFVARHPFRQIEAWDDLKDEVQRALRESVSEKVWEESDPDDLWREEEEVRSAVRPVLADIGETAQFLDMKRMTLDNEARDRLLDFLYEDLAAAFNRLIRLSLGDHSPDKYRERFPKFVAPDTGETPWQLFEQWVAEREPAASSVENWRYYFLAMNEHFKERSAASITTDEAQHWVDSLKTKNRSGRTIKKTWLNASKTVFGWAVRRKLISSSPFAAVTVTVEKPVRLRETQAFRSEEWRKILKAALGIAVTDTPDDAARRWVPWLCAYTGARVGEITQLRKADIIEQDHVPGLRITPEAGAVKGGRARLVPLHDQLIEQGFLSFVARHAAGPLFYRADTATGGGNPTKKKKPRAIQARQRLAAWVRRLGVTDKELQPNHAWRHTFKQIADHAGITERMSNYITGHSHKNEGAKYGAPTINQMADALKKFPTYKLD